MTTPAAIWADAMAARARKRTDALAGGQSTAEQAARDAALCDLFTRLCVDTRPDSTRIMAMDAAVVQDLHAACTKAEGIARRAQRGDEHRHLSAITRTARNAINIVRARIAHAHHAMGQPAPDWCRP